MKKLLLASILLAIISLGITGIAHADELGKVYICKFVGTPGVDERLQTGQNPIEVSINAIPDYQGIGSYFADAQGRSYVLATVPQDPEPTIADCPGYVSPTPTPTPMPTKTPRPTHTPHPKHTPPGSIHTGSGTPTNKHLAETGLTTRQVEAGGIGFLLFLFGAGLMRLTRKRRPATT